MGLPTQNFEKKSFEKKIRKKKLVKMVADKKLRSSDKEEELLLQDFSRRVSAKSSALFYGNAFIVSAIPIWLYWRIHAVDPASTAIILALITIASTWLVAFAYRNTKHVLKHKVAVKREAAVAKDMNKELDGGDKKISRKEKDERILWKKTRLLNMRPQPSASFTTMPCSWQFSSFALSTSLRPSPLSSTMSELCPWQLESWPFCPPVPLVKLPIFLLHFLL